MNPRPGDDDSDHHEMERDERVQHEAAATMSTGFAAFPLTMAQGPPDWRSGSRQSLPGRQPSLDLGFMGRGGFHMPPQPPRNLQPPLPPSLQAEMALMQRQRIALEEEQARLQRMSEAISFARRSSSTSSPGAPPVMESQFGRAQTEATQRLKKRRRAESSPALLSRRGNSFPMPRIDGDGYDIQIKPLQTYQHKWDEYAEIGEARFPDDSGRQREYTRCRFASVIGVRIIPLSEYTERKNSDDDDIHGQLKKRRTN